MTELTAEKVRIVMLAIRALRLAGKIAEHEPVSTEQMAAYSVALGCPVSEQTFRRAARQQLAIARRAVSAFLLANPQPDTPDEQ